MFADSPPENLCVVRLSHIGDTCHALAVVRSLQDNWPETNLTWIIGNTESSLMGDIAGVEFIIFDKRRGRRAYADVRAQLNGRKFDAALCMHASMRANGLYRIIQSPAKIGYDKTRARDFQWLFTNDRIAAAENEHVLDGMLRFARHIGAKETPLRWDIPISDADAAFAHALATDSRPLMVISPCSTVRSRNYRNWAAENYAQVAIWASERYGCRVVLTGGGSDVEKQYGRQIADTCGPSLTNLIGQTSLKQLLAVIARANLVLCPDSGPAHMATAVGTPVVGLYATSNPRRSGPYLSAGHTVDAYPLAVGRFLGKSVRDVRWGQRVRNPAAMSLIKIDDVKAKIGEIL